MPTQSDLVNIVIIGDGTVGKTCLLQCYSNESFLESYVPTVYDKEEFELMLNGRSYHIKLIDTAGQEDYERVRRLFYKEAQCFILCYSIENRASFENIATKWIPELKQIDHWPIPFILVATKIDLRQEVRASRSPLVSTDEGMDLAHRIYANRFIECSAKENVRVKDTVEEALRAVLHGPIEEEKPSSAGICSIFSCCNG